MDEHKGPTKSAKATEPKAGTGVRNLDTWRKLARARADMESDRSAATDLSVFERAGLQGLDSPTLSELELQLAELEPARDLQIDARRGAVAVVGPVVLAVAYNKAGVAQAGAAVNVGVNINVVKNVNETCGTGLY